jgi:hypothetical protein
VVNNDLGTKIFIWADSFFFLESAVGTAKLKGVVLEITFTSLVAYRTIERMI